MQTAVNLHVEYLTVLSSNSSITSFQAARSDTLKTVIIMSNWHTLIEWSKLLEPHEIIEKQSNYVLQAPFSLIIAVQPGLTANRIRMGGVGGLHFLSFHLTSLSTVCLCLVWQSLRVENEGGKKKNRMKLLSEHSVILTDYNM